MRALVLYNTRGMVAPLEIIRKRHLEHCDLFIHCGNSMVDFKNEFIEGYVVIQGQDDFEQLFLRDYLLTVDKQRLLIMNNIDYRGSEGMEKLAAFVDSLYDPVTIVICATEDTAHSERRGNVIFVSPGDASDRYSNTYAIIETFDSQVSVNFFDINSGELKKSDLYENTMSVIDTL